MFLMVISQTFIFSAQNEDAVIVYARIEETESIVAINDNREYDILRYGEELKFNIILKFCNRSNEKKELKDVKYYIFFDKDPSKETLENPVDPCKEGSLGEQTLEAGEEREETPIPFTYWTEVGDYDIYIQVGKGFMKATKINDLQMRVEPYPIKIHYYTQIKPESNDETPFDIRELIILGIILFAIYMARKSKWKYPCCILLVSVLGLIFKDIIENNYQVIAICIVFIALIIKKWLF